MSATAPLSTLDVSGTAPVPFSRLVRVELRKSSDTRASFWLLFTIGLIVLLAEAAALIATSVQDLPISLSDFVRTAAYLTSILLPVLGIMLVTAEWSQRTAMVSFVLEPRRSRVIEAKLVVALLLTLATAAAAIVIGVLCTLVYGLATGHADWTFGWGFFLGFLVTQALAMVGGFALAALVLNTPAAIVLFFVYRWVLPFVLGVASYAIGWFDDASRWVDFQRAQEPLYDMSISSGSEWAHLVVSGLIWLVAPLVLGTWRVLRAEVK